MVVHSVNLSCRLHCKLHDFDASQLLHACQGQSMLMACGCTWRAHARPDSGDVPQKLRRAVEMAV